MCDLNEENILNFPFLKCSLLFDLNLVVIQAISLYRRSPQT
jgi:hypothetical protein